MMHISVHQMHFEDCGNLQVSVIQWAVDRTSCLCFNSYIKAQSADWVIAEKEALALRFPILKGKPKSTIKCNQC